MKKYLFMAVAGMLALSGCSSDNDNLVNENTPRPMTFTAGYADGADTRATMTFEGVDKGKVSFDANDEISILSAKNANTKFTTAAGGATATFTGTAAEDSKFYAVYPYTGGLTLDGTTIKGVKIPTTQTNSEWAYDEEFYIQKWGWDHKAPIALAVSEPGNALKFHNLCAILKVQLNFNNGKEHVVTVSADEFLAGTFDLDTKDGVLTVTDGSKQVNTGGFENIECWGKRYIYLAIKPGAYTNFHLSVIDETLAEKANKTKSNVTFEAGKIYDLGAY